MNYKELLTRQIESGHLHHAYMIVGKYCDKDEIISNIVQILGVSREDVLKIENNESILIEEIKLLKREMGFPPFNSPRKIAIITPADVLTIQSQNALLKILEEPAARSVIFLLVNDEDRILPTIISRCQIVRLQPDARGIVDKVPVELVEGNLTMADKFGLAEKMAKMINLHSVLDGWLIDLTDRLIERPKDLKYLNLIREIDLAKKMLRSNSSVKLVLENLMLKF